MIFPIFKSVVKFTLYIQNTGCALHSQALKTLADRQGDVVGHREKNLPP
jgi:hypothetical protein